MKTTRPQTAISGDLTPPEDVWCLTIAHHRDPAHLGKRLLVVADASVFLGRSPGAFDDDRVSRKHTEVHADEDGTLWARDCDSRNGTFLNGSLIDRRTLGIGDVIGIGKILLVVHKAPVIPLEAESDVLVGVSQAFSQVVAQIDKVARRDTVAVFTGPPGSGKTAFARHLHQRSGREGELVVVHCGAIADEALHSELFGHKKGAFASATASRVGLIEAANGGTLVLDDAGSASRKLQLALMQFLDTGQIRRLGENPSKAVATRVVATTVEPLEERVRAGKTERDFADRLSGWPIAVPPLSERLDDIGPLAAHFARQYGGADAQLDPQLVLHLLRREWPGNVRELETFVEEAVIDADGDSVIGVPARARDVTERTPAAVVIAKSGEWFELAGAERVKLGHRMNLARILETLIAQRDAQPDMPLSVRELMAAGWPGESPVDKSGANRVYVALTTLRRLGLREVIERDRDGYFIPRAAPIDVAAS